MCAKTIFKLHGRTGGRVVCEPNEMAIYMVLNGIAHDERLNPPPSARGRTLVYWALSRITGVWHSTSAAVPDVELKMLEAGKFKRADGTKVTFTLPDNIKTAVAKLRLELNPPASLKPYRRRPARIKAKA